MGFSKKGFEAAPTQHKKRGLVFTVKGPRKGGDVILVENPRRGGGGLEGVYGGFGGRGVK